MGPYRSLELKNLEDEMGRKLIPLSEVEVIAGDPIDDLETISGMTMELDGTVTLHPTIRFKRIDDSKYLLKPSLQFVTKIG